MIKAKILLVVNEYQCAFIDVLFRPDHNLQDVRAKIFPLKRRKVKAPEAVPSVTLPVKRKERSLSSLVVSAPRVSAQTTMTRRRTNAAVRKAAILRGCSLLTEKPLKKEEDFMEDHQDGESSPETLNKLSQNVRQVKEHNVYYRSFVRLLFL